MIHRPMRPHFNFGDRQELLRAMATARRLAGMFGGSIEHNSPQHKLASALNDAIDALAAALTSDPAYYSTAHFQGKTWKFRRSQNS
jgi:hypothetical protein